MAKMTCAAIVLLFFASAASALHECDGDDCLSYMTILSGENQTPDPVDTDSSASFTIAVMEGMDGMATWSMNVSDVDQYTMAHLHLGNSSTNGPPVVLLLPNGPAPGADGALPMIMPAITVDSMSVSGTFNASDLLAPLESIDDLIVALSAGDIYANIHTVAYPAGEIRGQLMSM